ncbi:MAG: glycosyltransferase family 4 protein [Deltaproteobacteria bacterium]|nr:glycosyltransferase family 4 protein [Deltaproteobacteria bacterium]
MKVLHVVSYFPPDRIGGVGEVVAHLHRGLLAGGHESTVITSGTSRDDASVLRVARTPLRFLLALPRYVKEARKADLVHCHHGDALGLLWALRMTGHRIPVLATFHVGHSGMAQSFRPYWVGGRRFGRDFASWKYRNLVARLLGVMDRFMLRGSTGNSFISRSSAVDNLGQRKAREATVIYNALPPLPSRLPDPQDEFTELLFVGTNSHRKRVNCLPFVLQEVRKKIPQARLRIVGFDLAGAQELSSLFRELNLMEAVVAEGKVLSSELHRFYCKSGVLLVPSAYEGLPMVILEAFQCGLPCVATRVSGHPEVIDEGETGFLVGLDDPVEMAEKALAILTEPSLGERFSGLAGEVIAERFGLDRQLSEYLRLYEGLLERQGG